MNSVDLLRSLERYAVFDLATFEAVTGLDNASAKVRLFRMKKRGHIHEVQRNAYTVHRDPLVVSSRIAWPSYISLWYALDHHGMTHQVSHEISVLTPRRLFRDEVRFMGAVIRFVRIGPSCMFGYDKVLVDGLEVFMATPEKAIVDAVLLKRISMGEIMDILRDNMDRLDIDRMMQFIRRTGNRSLAKRMGFALERLGFKGLDLLVDMVYRTPIRLDYALDRDGPVDGRWGVVDNSGGGR